PTRPDCLPSMPAVVPACDRSWQGNPAVRRSTSAGNARKSAMFGRFGVLGNLARKTVIAGCQISQVKTVLCPASRRPCSRPPMPANNAAILILIRTPFCLDTPLGFVGKQKFAGKVGGDNSFDDLDRHSF